MILVGLTGSIGMGKSTTSSMFAEEDVPVYDADAAVHEVYAPGGAAVEPMRALFADAVVDNAVDRTALSARVLKDPEALKRLERLVHPLLADHRTQFLVKAMKDGRPLVVFDVPLLFETGGDKGMAAVVVVSCPEALQRARVLSRPGMTEDKLAAILKRQIPDAEKRARADFIIETGRGLDDARAQVKSVLKTVQSAGWKSNRPA